MNTVPSHQAVFAEALRHGSPETRPGYLQDACGTAYRQRYQKGDARMWFDPRRP